MPKTKQLFSQELIKILSKASESKIYGSVEVFFEAGQITQITQRIINKLTNYKKQSKPIKKPTRQEILKTKRITNTDQSDNNLPSTRTP